MTKVETSAASIFLLLIRLFWGWQFATTGWGKLTHLDKVTQFFTSLGIPLPHLNAMLVGTLEFAGGLFLMVGLASRVWALLLSLNMLVAYITDGRAQLLGIFSSPDKFYGYDAYPFLFAAMVILVFGAGLIALDRLVLPRLWSTYRSVPT
jgi:putative oxidoreductase